VTLAITLLLPVSTTNMAYWNLYDPILAAFLSRTAFSLFFFVFSDTDTLHLVLLRTELTLPSCSLDDFGLGYFHM